MADVEAIIEAAARHGSESEAGHEVGDLQAAVRAAGEAMRPDTRRRFLAGDAVRATLEWAGAKSRMRKASGVEGLLKAAEAHGRDSEPGHEAGDLQALLRAAWEEMDGGEREALLADPFVADQMDEWGAAAAP
jgi:hypothetical protein